MAQPNPNHEIGEYITTGGCADPANEHKHTPTNGEYETGNSKNGCGFRFGLLGTIGKYEGYKRVSYLGDKTACCLQHPAGRMIDGLTCPPGFDGPTSEKCIGAFTAHCKDGLWAKGSDCEAWANTWPDQAIQAMTNRCEYSPMTGQCMAWADIDDNREAIYRGIFQKYCNEGVLHYIPEARQTALKYRGLVNPAALAYCKREDADPAFCSCINSKIPYGMAECLDNKCYMQGYKTNPVAATCNQTMCSALFDMDDVGGNIEFRDVSLVQQCGENPNPPKKDPDDDDEVDVDDGGGEEVAPTEWLYGGSSGKTSFRDLSSLSDAVVWGRENPEIVAIIVVLLVLALVGAVIASRFL